MLTYNLYGVPHYTDQKTGHWRSTKRSITWTRREQIQWKEDTTAGSRMSAVRSAYDIRTMTSKIMLQILWFCFLWTQCIMRTGLLLHNIPERETKSRLFRQSYGWRGAVYSDCEQTSALSCAIVLDLDFCKVPPQLCDGSTLIHDICNSNSSKLSSSTTSSATK